VNSGRPVEYQIAYHWDMQFCRASSVVVGLCNGKSGASCVRPLGAPAGPDAYQILKCEYATLVDISSPSAPLVDMPNYAPNYDGCRIVSSDGWGTPVTCAKNEFMMGFCGSSDGEKCDVAAVRLQGAFFSVIRRVNNHKFSHQALCCPNP
jgi:hypothetical protein